MKKLALLFSFLVVFFYSLQGQKITFYANYAGRDAASSTIAGHVWVAFEIKGEKQVLGFYQGGLRDDSKRKSDISYTWVLDAKKYRAALDIISTFRNANYDLGTNDCRYFAKEVADSMGLKLPTLDLTKAPAVWMAELVELN
jgi:hypothetical protein